MTITDILKASARSAYRNMYRAASRKFAGILPFSAPLIVTIMSYR